MAQTHNTEILSRILGWLQQEVREPNADITPQTELIARNLLDSMDLLRLVSFLEESFDISLDPDLLVPENFETPERIAALVEQAAASG
jgi:acyl carrier protein